MDAKRRYMIERALFYVSAFFFLLTLVWRDWIEAVFNWDPDKHSGGLEWGIVAALLVVTVVFFVLQRSEKQRLATT
jgi:hypothetical protein